MPRITLLALLILTASAVDGLADFDACTREASRQGDECRQAVASKQRSAADCDAQQKKDQELCDEERYH